MTPGKKKAFNFVMRPMPQKTAVMYAHGLEDRLFQYPHKIMTHIAIIGASKQAK